MVLNMRLLTSAVFVVPFGKFAAHAVVGWWRRRRALVESAKEDLCVLNDPAVILSSITQPPEVSSHALLEGCKPTKDTGVLEARRNHRTFCARWARAAKARFTFARECEDSALNRAALHRWFLAQWKEQNWENFSTEIHKFDAFMTDAIDMALLPTQEFVSSESKRRVRKRARMEYYNERKFVEGWK